METWTQREHLNHILGWIICQFKRVLFSYLGMKLGEWEKGIHMQFMLEAQVFFVDNFKPFFHTSLKIIGVYLSNWSSGGVGQMSCIKEN